MSQEFETGKQAREAGAVGPDQWIPPIVSDSSTRVREMHDIDHREVWVRFAEDGDRETLRGYCRSEADRERMRPRSAPPAWWPVSWREGTAPPATFQVFGCVDGGFAAVDRGSSTVFYWHPGE